MCTNYTNTYDIQKANTLSEKMKNELTSLYELCHSFDENEYYFCIEEDADYYLCYDNSKITGVASAIPYDEGVCVYGLVHPAFRRKSVMTEILHCIISDLSASKISYIETHIPDIKENISNGISIPKDIFSFLSKTGFSLSHHEYLMEYHFCNFQNTDNLLQKSAIHSKYYRNTNDNHFIKNDFPQIECEFDDEENEFSLWIGEQYIGGCYIMPFYDENYVTFYDFEIVNEFRSKGYGRTGFILILKKLQDMHFDRLILHVSGENKIAHSLYTSCGLTVNSSFSVYRLSVI